MQIFEIISDGVAGCLVRLESRLSEHDLPIPVILEALEVIIVIFEVYVDAIRIDVEVIESASTQSLGDTLPQMNDLVALRVDDHLHYFVDLIHSHIDNQLHIVLRVDVLWLIY